MVDRYIFYGNRYMNYEPMISYHCYNYAIRHGCQDQTIFFKMNQLKIGIQTLIEDQQLQNEYLIEFIQKPYLESQQLLSTNTEKAMVTFLLVIDLLSEIGMVPMDMMNARAFIVNQGYIPQGMNVN